jgi:hypothetical protein
VLEYFHECPGILPPRCFQAPWWQYSSTLPLQYSADGRKQQTHAWKRSSRLELMAVFQHPRCSIQEHPWQYSHSHDRIEAHSWQYSSTPMAVFKHTHGNIPAHSWQYSSTLTTVKVFKHRGRSIRAPGWNYSSNVVEVFKHRGGSIQAHSHCSIQEHP